MHRHYGLQVASFRKIRSGRIYWSQLNKPVIFQIWKIPKCQTALQRKQALRQINTQKGRHSLSDFADELHDHEEWGLLRMTENNHIWIHHTVILKHITAVLHFVYNHRQLWRDTLGNSFYLDKWRKKSDIRINMCQFYPMTDWSGMKMADIHGAIFSKSISSIKINIFWWRHHWSEFNGNHGLVTRSVTKWWWNFRCVKHLN